MYTQDFLACRWRMANMVQVSEAIAYQSRHLSHWPFATQSDCKFLSRWQIPETDIPWLIDTYKV
jgi:hypothetical protein